MNVGFTRTGRHRGMPGGGIELSLALRVPLCTRRAEFIETLSMEHRWGNRREISHAVRVRTKSGVIATGTLKNISVSGALLSTDAPLRISGRVEVQMFARSKVVRPFTAVAAHVVRACPEGFGIEWSELSPPAVRFLNTVLEEAPVAKEEAQPVHATRRRRNSRRR